MASGDVQTATRHLGAHLVLSVAVAVPVPGMRSLVRFLWTLAYWAKAQRERFRRNGKAAIDGIPNVHTPLVMVLALLPGFGAVAYLASRPLRNKLLIRLILDQAAWNQGLTANGLASRSLPQHLERTRATAEGLAVPQG